MRDILDVGPGRAPDADDEDLLALGGPLGGLVAALRAPADLGPGVDAAVMAAVRLAPPLGLVNGGAAAVRRPGRPAERRAPPPSADAPFVRGIRWLARPRSVRVSPLGALAAAGLAFVAALGLRRDTGRRPEQAADLAVTGEHPAVGSAAVAAAPHATDTVFVTRFVLVAPGAKQVALVGDFNDWDRSATHLAPASHNAKAGVWTVEVPLRPGRYNYAFVVDGRRWEADPAAPRAAGDDFGRPSSVVDVQGA